MIAAVNKRDWTEAAVQLLDSKYAKQVGYRAEELAENVTLNPLRRSI